MTSIYRLRDLKLMTGVGRSAIYEWVAKGYFPKPIQLGPKAVGWRADEVDAWLASRPRVGGDSGAA